MAWAGYIADEHPAVAYLLSGAGMAHSKRMQSYLTMMAVRMLELHRVLKPAGTLYLHCNQHAAHYLKQLPDAIFGAKDFVTEIVWGYGTPSGGRTSGKKPVKTHDTLLVCAKKYGQHRYNIRYTPYSDKYDEWFKHVDDDGRAYRTRSRNGQIIRQYLDESPGVPLSTVWNDIMQLSSRSGWFGLKSDEIQGYPTQKPLALLERIIEASTEPGDVVLDPFAGCATACVAAEKLDRQWVGIDLSSKAAELVNERLRSEMGDLFHFGFVTSRKDVPQRTDIDSPKDYRTHKHVIYGEQEGHCTGCRTHFEFRHLTVDHIIPRSKGGTGHKDNLQLLCGHCNSVKGDRPMEYLLTQLADAAVLTGQELNKEHR